jgi:hypothetical protein
MYLYLNFYCNSFSEKYLSISNQYIALAIISGSVVITRVNFQQFHEFHNLYFKFKDYVK